MYVVLLDDEVVRGNAPTEFAAIHAMAHVTTLWEDVLLDGDFHASAKTFACHATRKCGSILRIWIATVRFHIVNVRAMS